jgi:hypothetical protein
MNYNKITNRVRARDLFTIFLLIGFVLASTRLENFHYQCEDYYYNPKQVNNELVLYEDSYEEQFLWVYNEKHEVSLARTEVIRSIESYTYTINSYNGLILTEYKAIISNTNYYSEIISIIQKTNISHKSSKKEPVLS